MKQLLLAGLVLGFCVTAGAQDRASATILADLRGSVVDPSGMPVEGAFVEIDLTGQKVVKARTNRVGQFHFRAAEGTFHIEIGFAPFSRILVEQAFTARSTPVFRFSDFIRGGGPSSIQVAHGAEANWEYGVQVSGGVGLEDRTNFSFLNAGVHAGKVLTDNYGSGVLRGNFEYGVEVIPFWQSYTPKFQRLNCRAGATTPAQCYGPTLTGGTYRGASIVPIILRINFTHGERFMPWIQGAGGVLYTTRKYPAVGNLNVGDPTQTGPAADTSVWNFTPQGGVGMHYFVKPQRSLDFSVNAEHISSASLGDKNPGVNDSVQFAVGYSWWK